MAGAVVTLADLTTFPTCLDESSRWYRAVPSKFPPADLWDQYASAREFQNAAVIEGLSSRRLRLQETHAGSIPPEEQLFGPGSTPVMAAFAYPNQEGSRFSPGDFGVYYAGDTIETVLAEVGYHRKRFWLDNPAQPRQQTFRVYVGQALEALVDIRGETIGGALHDPDSWSQSQLFGRQQFESQQWGIRYRSVRNAGGECIGLLRPLASSRVIQTAHVELLFDGDQVKSVIP